MHFFYIGIAILIGFIGCLLWVSWQESSFHDKYAEKKMEEAINKGKELGNE